MSYEWSYAPTNRATCKGKCKEKIEKGAIRFTTSTDVGDHTMAQHRCLKCITDKQIANVTSALGGLDKVPGFGVLSMADQSAVLAQQLGAAAGGGASAKAKAEAKAKAKAEAKAAKAKAKAGAAKAKAKAEPAAAAGVKRKAMPDVGEQHKFLDSAKDRDFEAVKAMVLANGLLVNVQPAQRWSALHQFAQADHVPAVKFLLARGADKGAKTKDGSTALDVATGACKALLSGRAAPPGDGDGEEDDEMEEEEDEEEEEEAAEPASSSAPPPAKKAKKSLPVDSVVPGRDGYSVVGDWSVLLNQTNVGVNSNKFYKIQVLESAAKKHFCWARWGRVGLTGQSKLEPCGDQAQAVDFFKKKFREKSGVPYESSSTHDWTPVIGKYTLVETEQAEGGEGGGEGAPLGKLTPQQIEKGQEVLKKLETALHVGAKAHVTDLQNYSSQYYTLIPHNFGMAVPPTISTHDMLEAEEELLKFYLRMGFEEVDRADDGLTPVSGIMGLDLPKSLEAACKGGGSSSASICGPKDIKSSTEKGKQHADKQSGGPTKPMEGSLYAAIMLYTSNAIYKDLNNVLRSEDRTKIKRYFPYLRLFLEAFLRLPRRKKTIWRGIGADVHDEYTPGTEVTWWGASSCTADISVAKKFMHGCGGKCTLFTIESKTAADISEITFFGNEKENLLAPGTTLKVLSCERKGKVTEIGLRETGRVLD